MISSLRIELKSKSTVCVDSQSEGVWDVLRRRETNQDVPPPSIVRKVADDAVGVASSESSLNRVAEGLRNLGGS